MNYTLFLAPAVVLTVFATAACAPTSQLQKASADSSCSKSMSAANNADCSAGSNLGPPVVDITKPTPSPGVASPTR
ncbi:MAG: hypothetical protein Q7J29_15150 [Stagnimonas sp.]|nr:hypothetical protein [Stagnimonas sp.]